MIPKYGQRITVTGKYVRVTDYNHEKYGVWKFWRRTEYGGKDCIFLGLRTLSNGVRECYSEEGCYFTPKEHFKAALVSPGPNVNPIYVPLDAVEYED